MCSRVHTHTRVHTLTQVFSKKPAKWATGTILSVDEPLQTFKVCACVCERESERECMCACVCVHNLQC